MLTSILMAALPYAPAAAALVGVYFVIRADARRAERIAALREAADLRRKADAARAAADRVADPAAELRRDWQRGL